MTRRCFSLRQPSSDLPTEKVKDAPETDIARQFAAKMEMIGYFMPVFADAFMSKHRKDSGVWTWPAVACCKQFLESKNNILEVATDCCWIFDPGEYRFSRRHFIAGAMYLHRDFGHAVSDGLEMFFAGEPYAFDR